MHSMTKDPDQRTLSRDGRYQIPKFTTIFTYRANPFGKREELVNEWLDWMFPFSLIPKDHYERRIRQASIMTTSYLYPLCKDIYRFERLVKWMSYLFVCDDTIEIGRDNATTQVIIAETLNCIKRLEAVYVNGESHNISLVGYKPFIICTYFVVEDILSDLNKEQRIRFLKHWQSYCLANANENELVEKQLLDLDEINKVRRKSGGMNTIFCLIEYSEKIYISDQQWQDERLQRLADLCNLYTIYVNDVYSFEKEYLEQNEDMTKMIVNIVGFHVLKYGCSISEAMDRSIHIIRKYECQFEELSYSLCNDNDATDEIQKFVNGLTAVNAGNFALSIHCNRYNNIYGTGTKEGD